MTAIQARIKESSRDFLHHVWPVISEFFNDGKALIEPVELASTDSVASTLDKKAGIDNWLIRPNGITQGLASRIQWPKQHRSFDTFTVRVRSRNGGRAEYQSRLLEMDTPGAITPYYWCQGYIACAERRDSGQHAECPPDNHRFLSAAVTLTDRLISAVRLDMGELLPRNGDGSQGYKVRWSKISEIGAPIRVWTALDDQNGLW